MFKKVWGPCLERLTWAVSIFLWASTDSCLMRVAWFRLGNGHGWTTDQRKLDTLYTKPSIMVVPLCFAKSCIGCVRCFHGEGSLCVPRHIQIHSNSGPIYTYTDTNPYTQCMSIQTQAGTPTEALWLCGMKVMNSVYDGNTLSSLSNLSQILVTFSLRCPVSASLTGIVQN